MVISELALGLITNLLYDSAKKTPGIHPDPSSKAYENAIKELNKKYRLSKGKIDNFLRQENVKVAIKEYLKNPNDRDFFKSLTDEFLASLGKDNFSREYAKSILNTFFEILDNEIEKDTDLRDYLKLYLSKQIYQEVQELSQGVQEITQGVQGTNQGVQRLSQGLQEMSERVLEIHAKVVNDNKMDQTFKKEPDRLYQNHFEFYNWVVPHFNISFI